MFLTISSQEKKIADTQVRDNVVVVRRSAGFAVQEREVWDQEQKSRRKQGSKNRK